jgi:type I restriction enzyme S subunit
VIDSWKKKSVGDIADVVTGKTPPTSDRTNYGDHLPFVSPADLGTYKYISKSEKHLSEKGAKKARILPVGTSLFTCIGSTIGKVGLTAVDLTTNQQINAAIPKNGSVNKEYLYYALCDIAPRVKRIAGVQAVPIINKTEFENQIIYLPADIPEQKAIADLLSTWDEAIEKTERLIQAKEKRFKQLLNDLIHQGRSNHTWKGYNLSDLCSPVSRKNGENNTNVLTSSAQNGLVSQIEYYNKSVSAENVTGYYLLKKGEFAYNRSSAKGYPYGATKRLDRYEKGVLSTLYLCFALKPDAPCESDFLLHLFESGAANRELRAVCQEGARSHGLLNITKADFFGIKLFLPSQDQQKKIQSALNTAQNEIDLLKQLADKYKTQKRGLMQKMLTGEWRVRGFAE